MTDTQHTTMIAARNLSKRVATAAGPLDILTDIGLEIRARETVAVAGVSGSGKSTLMHILGLLDSPTTGSSLLDGEEVFHQDIFDTNGNGNTTEWLGGWLVDDVEGGSSPFTLPAGTQIDGISDCELRLPSLNAADTTQSLAAFDLEGDQRARARALTLVDFVLRISGPQQPREMDGSDMLVGRQHAREHTRALALPVHAHAQRFQRTKQKPTRERRCHRTHDRAHQHQLGQQSIWA